MAGAGGNLSDIVPDAPDQFPAPRDGDPQHGMRTPKPEPNMPVYDPEHHRDEPIHSTAQQLRPPRHSHPAFSEVYPPGSLDEPDEHRRAFGHWRPKR